MKKPLIFIIIIAFTLKSAVKSVLPFATQNYCLRPMSEGNAETNQHIKASILLESLLRGAYSRDVVHKGHSEEEAQQDIIPRILPKNMHLFKSSSAGSREKPKWHIQGMSINDSIQVPFLNTHAEKLTTQQVQALDNIEGKKYQIRRKIKGKRRFLLSRLGKDFNEVYWIDDTLLVEKRLREGQQMSIHHDSLELAMSRLRGLAAKTYIYHERLIQEYVEPLMRHKGEGENHGLLVRFGEEEAKSLIDDYFNLLYSIWRRGVFDIDFGLYNCGRNLTGKLVVFDFGAMISAYPDQFELSRLRVALEKESKGIRAILPASVCNYYDWKMYELCGDSTAYNNIFRNFNNKFEVEQWHEAQNVRHKRLGLPHPYPLHELVGFKSFSAGQKTQIRIGKIVAEHSIAESVNSAA